MATESIPKLLAQYVFVGCFFPQENSSASRNVKIKNLFIALLLVCTLALKFVKDNLAHAH